MKPENQEPKRHIPEFIFLETEQDEPRKGFRDTSEDFKQSFKTIQGQSYPAAIRLVFFFFAFVLVLFSMIITPIVLFFIVFNFLTLFKLETFNRNAQQLWNAYKKLLVMGVGLTLAVFSPPLGISVIMIYFMMRGEQFGNVWVNRFMQPPFGRKS